MNKPLIYKGLWRCYYSRLGYVVWLEQVVNSPPLEGWQAKPDGVGVIVAVLYQPPPAFGVPPPIKKLKHTKLKIN
ncbi:MAG: hypothetical protein RL344_635 [Pseudomonadota bacterium]|jgi:hypothetical protein